MFTLLLAIFYIEFKLWSFEQTEIEKARKKEDEIHQNTLVRETKLGNLDALSERLTRTPHVSGYSRGLELPRLETLD